MEAEAVTSISQLPKASLADQPYATPRSSDQDYQLIEKNTAWEQPVGREAQGKTRGDGGASVPAPSMRLPTSPSILSPTLPLLSLTHEGQGSERTELNCPLWPSVSQGDHFSRVLFPLLSWKDRAVGLDRRGHLLISPTSQDSLPGRGSGPWVQTSYPRVATPLKALVHFPRISPFARIH